MAITRRWLFVMATSALFARAAIADPGADLQAAVDSQQGAYDAGNGAAHLEPTGSRYFPVQAWDRYGRRRPFNPFTLSDGTGDYPIVPRTGWWDAYNTNWLKSDEPIAGEYLFFRLDLINNFTAEIQDFGSDRHHVEVVKDDFFVGGDLFWGDAAFRPPNWRVRVLAAVETFHDDVKTLNSTKGDAAIQEAFGELLIAAFDPYFDTLSVRGGRQGFASDLRKFVFADVNDGVRFFGTADENRWQYDVAGFDLAAKDFESNFNNSQRRDQRDFFVNVIRQDFLARGYTAELSFTDVHDDAKNEVRTRYLTFSGDGHIGAFEVSHTLSRSFGRDERNPVSGAEEDVQGSLVALEVAYPIDWFRPIVSVLWASGDSDPGDGKGEGFDGVFDTADFAGGAFSFWGRQAVNAGGVGIDNNNSFYPDLRTKANDAPNSVNPGLLLVHAGFEAAMSNYVTVFGNVAWLQFNDTSSLERKAAQVSGKPEARLARAIGFDVSLGAQYRPLGVDNVIVQAGVSALFPQGGFRELNGGGDPLLACFVAATILF